MGSGKPPPRLSPKAHDNGHGGDADWWGRVRCEKALRLPVWGCSQLGFESGSSFQITLEQTFTLCLSLPIYKLWLIVSHLTVSSKLFMCEFNQASGAEGFV